MPTPLLPDVLALARAALLAQPSVTDLVGRRVHERVPTDPTYPLLRLAVVDDYEQRPGAGVARIQVDAWSAGPTPSDHAAARQAAATVVAATRDLVGVYGPLGAITVAAPGGTTDQPDPDTGRQRCFVALHLEYEPDTKEP